MAGDEVLRAPAANVVKGGGKPREEGEQEEELTADLVRLPAGSGRTGRRQIDGDRSFGEREIREGKGIERPRGEDRAAGRRIRRRGRRAGAPGGLQQRAGRQEVAGSAAVLIFSPAFWQEEEDDRGAPGGLGRRQIEVSHFFLLFLFYFVSVLLTIVLLFISAPKWL